MFQQIFLSCLQWLLWKNVCPINCFVFCTCLSHPYIYTHQWVGVLNVRVWEYVKIITIKVQLRQQKIIEEWMGITVSFPHDIENFLESCPLADNTSIIQCFFYILPLEMLFQYTYLDLSFSCWLLTVYLTFVISFVSINLLFAHAFPMHSALYTNIIYFVCDLRNSVLKEVVFFLGQHQIIASADYFLKSDSSTKCAEEKCKWFEHDCIFDCNKFKELKQGKLDPKHAPYLPEKCPIGGQTYPVYTWDSES